MVSVIIPVYNTEKYLERCVDSILGQTVTDLELILIDDESTDHSGRLCDQYQRKDSRVKVYHQKNAGPSAARQKGVSMANGEWIMFADSDDWLELNTLEVLLKNQEESNANMVCAFFVDVDQNGKKHHLLLPKEEILDFDTAEQCIDAIHRSRAIIGSPCAKLIRKTLFQDLKFCNDVTIGEDYSMIVELVQKAEKVRVMRYEPYNRFVRKGSISHMGYSDRHHKAFDNYMRVRMELIERYPSCKEAIIGFHVEYEMAVLTAMCRNWTFDPIVIDKLKKDLRKHMKLLWDNETIALYMKVSAWMIAYPTKLFILLFRLLYLCTGR